MAMDQQYTDALKELEQVKAERDELARDLETERHHRQSVERSEQALAAHLALIAPALRETRLCLDHARVFISSRQKMHEHGREAHEECIRGIDGLLGSAPTTSLARRDLLKQAEAIRSAIKQGYRSADELESWAAFLERQAEESTP